ncbi:MAG: L,D-transpeptidase [Candidatus Koribacter versatilis]|nr:L,D-transpeptidase [Candidatus Koribacter versatilis]
MKAAWLLAVVLAVPSLSAALQTDSASVAPVANELVKASMRRVLVSIPERKLALLENGTIRRIYRVAVGKTSTPSPVGDFKIVNRVSNPTYYHPGQVIPASNSNPVGSRWMGLSAKGYGIHGTNQPNSIGKAASTGCIRMGKEDVEELFALVEVGDPVEIRDARDEQAAAIFGTDAETTIAQAQTQTANDGGQ